MSGRLDGQIAVITGGTSGIGEATAELFVGEGASVVIAGRSDEKGKEMVRRLGEGVAFKHTDVMNVNEIEELMHFSVERFGRIDCLFNNAGGPSSGDLETVSEEDFNNSVQLLLGSVVFGIKYAAPIMKKQKSGTIINNASVAAHRLNQGGALYTAVKASVTHYTRLAGMELGSHGIRVNSISPGAIATPIFWGGSERARTLSHGENEKKMGKLKKNLALATPLPRAGLSEDVAKAALYLASDDASFVNCHDLIVDGGRIASFYEKPAFYGRN
jgi:NAD(P)-dependent dehydrogenase (short-subunit alcohol dehydrogenase family)